MVDADIPVVLSHRILQLAEQRGVPMWLGGGEVDVKWRVHVPEFVRCFSALVADVTEDGPEP